MNLTPLSERSQPSLAKMAAERLSLRRTSLVMASLKAAASLTLIPSRPSLRQLEFLALTVEEALFGGAAGGGKTETVLMAALQYIDVPGYSAGIFRRTKTEALMPDAPLARAKIWFAQALLTGRARWDDKSNTFFFRTRPGEPDSSIHFGYLDTDKDLGRYQGAAFQFIAVDELTFWEEHRYRFLFSRCRPSAQLKAPVPCRMRATTNPGGPGHRWVKERFVSRAVHVQTGAGVIVDINARRHNGVELPTPALYVSPPSPEAIELARELGRKPRQAYFVPAFAADNPFLVGEKLFAYREQLLMLDPVRRKQLEWGDWEVENSGGFFTAASFELVERLPDCLQWLRSWDMAATEMKPGKDPDWTASAAVGLFHEQKPSKVKRFCVQASIEHFREEPARTEARVVARAKADGRLVTQLFEIEPGSSGKFVMRNWHELLSGHSITGVRRTGPKESYWGPLAGHCANVAPMLIQVRNEKERQAAAELISELTSIPVGHDDQADMLSLGYAHFLHAGDGTSNFSAPIANPAPLRSARI